LRSGWAALVATTLSRGLIAAIGGLVSTSLLPALLGWHTAVVLSGSMEPRLVTGDIVVVRHIAQSQLNPGQILLVHDPDHPGDVNPRWPHRDGAGWPQWGCVSRGRLRW
jgi:signal peptidase